MRKPPTNEEICEQFERLEQIEDAEERQRVVAGMLQASSFLPKKMVKKYKGLDNYDDLYQVACIVLLKAIRSFNYKKSRNFYAWCYRWIKKEVARAALRHKQYLEQNEVVDFWDACMSELVVSDLEEFVFDQERGAVVERALGGLGNRSRYIINKVFGIEGSKSSLRSIGREIQVSHEQVRRMKEAALKQLGSNRALASLWRGEI